MRIVKLALAVVIALALLALWIPLAYFIAQVPFIKSGFGWLAVVAGFILWALLMVVLQYCAKHVPFLISLMKWIDDRGEEA